MQLIDLSQTIRPGMPRFDGMPDPMIRAWKSHAQTAASGVYVGRLRADGTSAAVRLTLIK